MQNVFVTARGSYADPQLPGGWALASAEIVENLDQPKLPALIAQALNNLLRFESCIQFVYAPEGTPINLFEGAFRQDNPAGLQNYLKRTYLIDPFYQMFRSGIRPGAYRMRDIAAQAIRWDDDLPAYPVVRRDSEEIGYLTRGWPSSREELSIALNLPDGCCAEISLARPWSHEGFSGEEVGRLNLVVPFLQAAVNRYWKSLGATTAVAQAPEPLKDKRFEALSPRECEVVDLLLSGHSTLSISLRLGISPTTVKSHRKNSYAKLGIATQYELYALSLRRI